NGAAREPIRQGEVRPNIDAAVAIAADAASIETGPSLRRPAERRDSRRTLDSEIRRTAGGASTRPNPNGTSRSRERCVPGRGAPDSRTRANRLFIVCCEKSARTARLVKTLVSNSTFDRGSLSPTYFKPFDVLANGRKTGDWLARLFELGGGPKRLYIAQPADHWVPTGAVLVHQLVSPMRLGLLRTVVEGRIR